jgi:hypothetical protein
MSESVKCFRLGPSDQIRKTKLKAKMTPKSQMYFAALNLEDCGFWVVELSGVNGLMFYGTSFQTLFSYGNSCFCFFFRLVGMTLVKMAIMDPMIRPAHMKSAAMPKMA